MGKAGNLKINGKDAWTTWGMTMDTKAMSALMTPPGTKENIKNSSRTSHGTQVLRTNVRMAARTVTLVVQFSAKTEDIFMQRYLSFCEELSTGFLNIETRHQPGVVYKMEYNQCPAFTEFRMGIAKYTLKLTENDPSDRRSDV